MRLLLRRSVAIAATLSAAMLAACLWHETAARADPRLALGEHRLDLECGRGQLKGLPAGPVRIHLVESGEVISTREVDVMPGRIVDVDFP